MVHVIEFPNFKPKTCDYFKQSLTKLKCNIMNQKQILLVFLNIDSLFLWATDGQIGLLTVQK